MSCDRLRCLTSGSFRLLPSAPTGGREASEIGGGHGYCCSRALRESTFHLSFPLNVVAYRFLPLSQGSRRTKVSIRSKVSSLPLLPLFPSQQLNVSFFPSRPPRFSTLNPTTKCSDSSRSTSCPRTRRSRKLGELRCKLIIPIDLEDQPRRLLRSTLPRTLFPLVSLLFYRSEKRSRTRSMSEELTFFPSPSRLPVFVLFRRGQADGLPEGWILERKWREIDLTTLYPHD